MNCPVVFDFLAAGCVGDGDWKIRFANAVGELEYDAENDSADECRECVNGQHRPPGVEHHWNAERQRKEYDFAGDKNSQVFSLGAGNFVIADLADGELIIIVDQVPLDGHEPVKKPKIN